MESNERAIKTNHDNALNSSTNNSNHEHFYDNIDLNEIDEIVVDTDVHTHTYNHSHTVNDHAHNYNTMAHTHILEDTSHKKDAHSHPHTHTNTKAVINRLSKAKGHLESVKRMVEDGRDCSEVLIQLSAVISALTNTGKIILQEHIEHCIVEAVESGDKKAIEDLNKAINLFIK